MPLQFPCPECQSPLRLANEGLAGVGGVLLLCGGCIAAGVIWVNQQVTGAAQEFDKLAREDQDRVKKAEEESAKARKAKEEARKSKKATDGPHVEVLLGAVNY